jgi:hypothetical protein
MGGIGSGRKAEVYSGTVEESLQLDVNKFAREGVIKPHGQASGIIAWERLIGQTPSIGYEVQCYGENGHIRLQYTASCLAMGKRVVNYDVELFTTKPNYGCVRWWFICPNQECNKMVVKLYQPPGTEYFLCRTCHNLTYQSCRNSGKTNLFIEALERQGRSGKNQ